MKKLNHKAFNKFLKANNLSIDAICKGMQHFEFHLVSKYAMNPFIDVYIASIDGIERPESITLTEKEYDLLKYFIILDPYNQNVSFVEANVMGVNNFEQFIYGDECAYIANTDLRTIN